MKRWDNCGLISVLPDYVSFYGVFNSNYKEMAPKIPRLPIRGTFCAKKADLDFNPNTLRWDKSPDDLFSEVTGKSEKDCDKANVIAGTASIAGRSYNSSTSGSVAILDVKAMCLRDQGDHYKKAKEILTTYNKNLDKNLSILQDPDLAKKMESKSVTEALKTAIVIVQFQAYLTLFSRYNLEALASDYTAATSILDVLSENRSGARYNPNWPLNADDLRDDYLRNAAEIGKKTDFYIAEIKRLCESYNKVSTDQLDCMDFIPLDPSGGPNPNPKPGPVVIENKIANINGSNSNPSGGTTVKEESNLCQGQSCMAGPFVRTPEGKYQVKNGGKVKVIDENTKLSKDDLVKRGVKPADVDKLLDGLYGSGSIASNVSSLADKVAADLLSSKPKNSSSAISTPSIMPSSNLSGNTNSGSVPSSSDSIKSDVLKPAERSPSAQVDNSIWGAMNRRYPQQFYDNEFLK
jgi:hypothetical protein